MSEPIVIVDCDPRWPERFEEEKALLQAAVGPHIESDFFRRFEALAL